VKGKDAQKLGLVDAVVSNKADLVPRARELALQIASGARPFNRTLKLYEKLEPADMSQAVLGQARELVQRQAAVVGPHPLAAVEAVAGCVANARDGVRGIGVEADQFMRCVGADSSSALMYLFFAKKTCAKVPGLLEAGVKPRQLRKFGIIGGGLMGSGIATAVLLSGGQVILKEVEQKFLDAGVQRIRGNLEARVKRGAMTAEQLTATMGRLRPSLSYEPFRDAEVVIEAVFENLALKQQLFADLEASCSPTCLLATNTSTIDIPSIGAKLKSPGAHERLVGLHFFSPAQVMPLLEIVRPPKASKQAVADSLGVATLLGKTPIVVGNCPGFAANRIFFPYFQSAALLVDFGVDPYRIDKVLQAFGLPMGVFRLTDMIGVEVSSHVAQTFLDSYPDRIYPAAIYRLLLQAKRFGDRSGAGFYKHANGKASPDPELQTFVTQSRAQAKIQNQVRERWAILSLLVFILSCRPL
jgi:enoyl-CoA hydratase/3-hydroxyacyl-CoA dehydrogenase